MLVWTPLNVRRLRPIFMLLLGVACVGSASTLRLRGDEPPKSEQPTVADPSIETVQLENAPDQGMAANDLKPVPQRLDGAKAKRRGNAGRLPPYYASVVDDRQRQAIYEIRARMASEFEQLEKQLDALRQSEMAEIEGVLTAAQRAQIEALRAKRAMTAKAKSVESAVK